MARLAEVRATLVVCVVLAVAPGCNRGEDPRAGSIGEAKAATTSRGSAAEADRAARGRDEALRNARVWTPPPVLPGKVDFAANPPGPDTFPVDAQVTCQFVPKAIGGTTPKFYCELPGGELVRVKYGSANPELHAEVAASRLLAALGFGADRMYVVRSVRCAGCPQFPFQALQCFAETGLESACFAGRSPSRTVDFDPVVIERRFPGKKIEAVEDQGWAWYELDRMEPSRGTSRAEVDALKLVAVFLAHWDNKAANQRLVCLPGGELPDGGCTRPFALIQDLGATFGPYKVDLANWRRTGIWTDARACRVSMEHLPWGGGTFPEQTISEGGRRFALGLLEQLSDAQLKDLFTASRITAFDDINVAGRDAGPWVEAFKEKVRSIKNAGPCPET